MAKKSEKGNEAPKGVDAKLEGNPGFESLLYQLLETEQGGVQIYTTALRCVVNEDLKEEWTKYLDETKRHVEVATRLLEGAGLDPAAEPPARLVVRHLGQSIVRAMEMALKSGEKEEAQLVATECVVLAETKDHANWEMVGFLAKKEKGPIGKLLREAHEEVEDEEDHHLYHSAGWSRELKIESLGYPAVLPPPEEEKDVETAIGAARAKNAREEML